MQTKIIAEHLLRILPTSFEFAIPSRDLVERVLADESRVTEQNILSFLSRFSTNPESPLSKLLSQKAHYYYHPAFISENGIKRSIIPPRKKSIKKNLEDFSLRDQEIFELYKNGLTLQEIGNMFNLTRERVRQILLPAKKLGFVSPVNRPHIISQKALKSMREKGRARRGKNQKFPNRNAKIQDLVNAGLSYSQVGKKLNISRSTVCSVIYRIKHRDI